MPRYKLTIEYDGTPFVGWQVQDNGVSVQGVLTDAIAGLRRRARRGPGRRAHRCRRARARPGRPCRSRQRLGRDTVRDALNAHLRPQPVAVLAAEQVADSFDARFSAIKRHYLYRIVNRRADLTLDQQPRLARAAPARCRRHARRRATARRPARLHDLPRRRVPGEIAGEDARSPRRRRATATRCASPARRARSCTIRCARWSARWCTSAKANGAPTILPRRSPPATAPPAARSRRRTGFIWCGWSIDLRFGPPQAQPICHRACGDAAQMQGMTAGLWRSGMTFTQNTSR